MEAEIAATALDNGLMLATNSWPKRSHGSWPDSRTGVRPVPIAITLLYALEPVAAALCLICFLPFLLILALAIRVASGASPLVAHRRVGRHGKTLWVYKFRTMWPRGAAARPAAFFVEKVADDKPRLKMGPDPRVTSRFASFCRRHSLDELPQLALIAAGRMSVVGPRPITRFELNEYYDPHAMEVLSIKPGLTGLWQVRGRSRLTYRQRKRFDLFLVRRFSLGLYFRIVTLTIPDVLFARNAW
jgi:lipopolysaccharide/colanic/teichoic acid biosynthesis glycosyltransferase